LLMLQVDGAGPSMPSAVPVETTVPETVMVSGLSDPARVIGPVTRPVIVLATSFPSETAQSLIEIDCRGEWNCQPIRSM
jgi:hypothetical protein